MPEPIQQPQGQPSTPLPEPSYAQQVIETIAAELERTANRRRLLTEVGLRRAFTVSVAARLHHLPTAVANEGADHVAELLPDTGPLITHGEYALHLREIAGTA
jgi:CRP-like cAMP-binding protein